MKYLLFLLFMQLSVICEKKYSLFLTNRNVKFWDAEVGYGFLINSKDTSVMQYYYDKNGKRVMTTYGDVMDVHLKWELLKDTIRFKAGRVIFAEMIVENFSDTILEVNDVIQKRKVKYFKSKDQESNPTLYKTSMDSLDPIKYRFK